MESFQIQDDAVCAHVPLDLGESTPRSRVPSVTMPLTRVSQPLPHPHRYFATYVVTLPKNLKCTPHPLLYLFIY